MHKFSRALRVTVAGMAAVSLAACGTPAETDSAGADTSAAGTVEITDNRGSVSIPEDPQSIVITDNRLFQTAEDWGIELAAAPVTLVPADSSYKTNESIVDLGSHREPDLEAIVAVEPDLIINGGRFDQYYDDFSQIVPDAALVDLNVREDQPFDEELRRQTTQMGEILGHEEEAEQLVADFDAAIERASTAYDSEQSVMGVITSGGEINYAAPGDGRTLGPVFDILELTPSLETDGSSNHEGDDISVEAIADSDPDWILVMDRDAAVSANNGESYTPANELLAESAALQNVTAVQEDRVIYMPQYTYVNEGIQTYTTFFNDIADAMEQADNA